MKNLRATSRFLLLASALTFSLTACGGSGSSSSSTASSTDKTASWTNVNIRALDGKVNINWDKAANSSQTTTGSTLSATQPTYNIYCSTDPTDIVQDKNRIAANYEGQSFDHTNVTNGQRYYYAVTGITAAGEGPASRIVSATPQAVLPAAPYGLKVTALDSSAKLEFMGPTPPGNVVVNYNLYRSTSRDFTADIIRTPLATFTTPYIEQNLNNGTTYYFAVTAVVAGNESVFSPVVSAQPLAKVAAADSSLTQLAAFSSPGDMSAAPGNGSCVITWIDVSPLVISSPDPAASATPDYILFWSNSSDVLNNVSGQADNVTKVLTKDTNGLFTYTLSGLNNGTTYYLQLVAAVKDAGGNPIPGRFTPGPVVSATPALKTPAIPSGVSATQGSQQVSLTWNKDTSGISGVTYNIYYSATDAASPAELMTKAVKVMPSTTAHFTHSGLDTGKTYYYVITSVGEGESAPSNIISVTL